MDSEKTINAFLGNKVDSTANTPSHFRLGDGAFLASPVASG